MSGRPQDRWVDPLCNFLSAGTDHPEERSPETDGYFCRTCGTTFEAHQAACPDCGSHMLEQTTDVDSVTKRD
jgi:DNA-directed RNA polymerase subunit RPC12/RpoP